MCSVCEELATLKQRLAEAETLLEWYADPENYIRRNHDGWKRVDCADDELIKNYRHPQTEWIGSVSVSGRRAREYFQRKKGGE
jgi:hypothetical protein